LSLDITVLESYDPNCSYTDLLDKTLLSEVVIISDLPNKVPRTFRARFIGISWMANYHRFAVKKLAVYLGIISDTLYKGR